MSWQFREIVLTQIVTDLKIFCHRNLEAEVDFEKCRFSMIVTLPILFYLLFICRNSILLRARVQSAIQKKLLCFSHPILLLKLARDLDECSETKPDASLPSFFNWKWWMPSCTLPQRSKRTIIINSCRELDK